MGAAWRRSPSRSGPTSFARGATSASAASRRALEQFDRDRSRSRGAASSSTRARRASASTPAAEHLAAKYGMSVEQAEASHAQMTELAAQRGARVPPRPHARRQQLRRAPADPPRRRARPPGRGEGAPDARATSPRASRSATARRSCDWPRTIGLDAARRAPRSTATRTPTRSAPTRSSPQRIGIQGVPFFVLDRRYGVSGAQPAEHCSWRCEKRLEKRRCALSVLDQSPVPEGSTGPDALRNTLDLARLADRLGYHRYWLAEHHGLSLAGPSPEVLIGPVAAATERIRVGSGGVMLPHYSPFKVAENFSLLAGPVPGPDRPRDRPRVRHRPADHLRAPARPARGLARRLPAAARRAARALRPHPARPTTRSRGSATRCPAARSGRRSGCSARRRRARCGPAQLDLPYAFADFINPNGAEIAALVPRAGRRTRAARSACGRSAPTPTRRPSGSRPRSRCRWRCCARAGRSRCRRPRRRCATSPQHGDPASGRRRIVGSPGHRARRDRGGRRGVRRRRGDRRDDHARPRRPPPLLRADRRGVRGCAACRRSGRSATSGCCRLSSSPSSRRPASSG